MRFYLRDDDTVSFEREVYRSVNGIVECPAEVGAAAGLEAVPEGFSVFVAPTTLTEAQVEMRRKHFEKLLESTVEDFKDALKSEEAKPPAEDLAVLRAMEVAGKNRKGVLDALDALKA